MAATLTPAAPSRTDRQIIALHAAVSLLQRLGGIAALVVSVHADWAPDFPVSVDAQISVHEADPGPGDAARFDRLVAAAVALNAPITREWATSDQQAFALTGVRIDTVPVHLWAVFTDPDVIARAHALAALNGGSPMTISDTIAAYRTSGKALRAMDRGPRPTRNFGATEKAYAFHNATRSRMAGLLADAGRGDLVHALIDVETLPARITDSPGPRPELRQRLKAARATLRAAQNQQNPPPFLHRRPAGTRTGEL